MGSNNSYKWTRPMQRQKDQWESSWEGLNRGLRQICTRPAPGLSSPASPNNNDIRLIGQSNCIWLAHFNQHSIPRNIGLCVFERFRPIPIFKECAWTHISTLRGTFEWCHHSTPLLQDRSLSGSLCSHTYWLRPEPIFMRFDPKLRSVEAPGIWHPILIFSILLWLAGKNLEKRTQCSVYVSTFSATLAMRTWRFEEKNNVMISPYLPTYLPTMRGPIWPSAAWHYPHTHTSSHFT